MHPLLHYRTSSTCLPHQTYHTHDVHMHVHELAVLAGGVGLNHISSYFYVKAIAEELRGLAVEFNVPIFSATQTTRTGYVSTDIGLEDTSESFGLPATADFMFALISNEELEALGQMKVKQLKNRYNDPSINRAFIIGVDRAKMKLYDVQQKAQDIVDANQKDEKEDAYDKFSDFKI
mgnify:CR=1 FL=1